MDNKKIQERIKNLRQEISTLRYKYHVTNDPSVTDDVYESLTRELRDLESQYPHLKEVDDSIDRVAGEVSAGFTKVNHDTRMLSLNDAFSNSEVTDWEVRIKKLLEDTRSELSYFCELKFDGLAVSLKYKDGVFVRGSTRGDGFIGEDITENLKMIKSIPLKLKYPYPETIEVRGEVVMGKKILEKINKENAKNNKTIFANTRNAAAGSLRQLDPNIVKQRNLDFFAYDIPQIEGFIDIHSHSQKHKVLKELGFVVDTNDKKSKDLKQVFEFIDHVAKIRDKFPYGTDGVVICVDDNNIQDILGVVGKAPRYAIAYKYPAERATTVVQDITINVGRTGVLTPLAHFTPTLVAGSTVSKATLHNMDQIERLDIRVGDTVVIQKAGDVIPEVVETLIALRTGKEKKFKMPEKCPVCGNSVQKQIKQNASRVGAPVERVKREYFALSANAKTESSVAYYCTNKSCSAKNRRGMQHFVNVYEIYEIGPKVLDRLKEEGLITDSADLFTLEISDLSGLTRFGEKSALNIINSIQNHKNIPFWRFIYGLGILHVGEVTSQDIANKFMNLDGLLKATLEDINSIEGVGPVVSESVYEYLKHKENIKFINKLLNNGVKIVEAKNTNTGKLKGKVFVLTGTLPTLARDDAKKMILSAGGKVASSVSKNTSYVLAGVSAGSKYDEANKLHIPIISEPQFLKML